MTNAPEPYPTIGNRYQIIAPIGRGSFGRTFVARDLSGDRSVAVKLLDRRDDVDLKTLELFQREASVLRSLRHHGVPEVYDVIEDQWEGATSSFLVMELVEGRSLEECLAAGESLDSQQVMHLFLEMLSILEYLHGRVPPIVHRDIKPANIIVRPDGTPALVDFGSVRGVFLDAGESGSTIVGTYGYMPYEQYMGQAAPTSDLYSLAATFLHLLTGRPPRDFMKGEGRLEVPESLPGDARLRPLLAQMLRPSPAERLASAREVRNALLASTAMTTTGMYRSSTHLAIRQTVDLSGLAPAPRPMDAQLLALEKRLAPSWLEYLDSDRRPGDDSSALSWLTLGLFSLLTAGLLPAIFAGKAATRRRRVRRFLRHGVPCAAEVLHVEERRIDFGVLVVKVSYRFEADGETINDSDEVLSAAARRWQPGNRIQLLYLPDRCESVIVSGR